MTRAYRATWHEPVSERQLSIMLGSLLGDGSLWKTRNANQVTYFNTATAVEKYAEWKFSELRNLCTRNILIRHRNRLGTPTTAFDVCTASHPVFRGWRDVWYPEGKKQVPANVAIWLSPLAIAVWFMDDGYRENDRHIGSKIYHGRKIGFCTDAFSDQSRDLLIEALRQHRVQAYVVCGNRLTLDRQDSRKLVELMRPHVLPFYSYKLDIYSPDVRCND